MWNDPSRWMKHPVGKFRYVGTRALWEVYCKLRDLRWPRYDPLPSAGSFEILFNEVQRDPTGIFRG